jgi:hypothetical protein
MDPLLPRDEEEEKGLFCCMGGIRRKKDPLLPGDEEEERRILCMDMKKKRDESSVAWR